MIGQLLNGFPVKVVIQCKAMTKLGGQTTLFASNS